MDGVKLKLQMSNYKGQVQIEAIDDNYMPYIHIEKEALIKMESLIDVNAQEVSWLGTVVKKNNDYIIDDVFLFDQKCTAASTDISEETLAKFGEKLLERKDGIEIWNNLRFWGHSHVNMLISPSGTDDKQMEIFQHGNPGFFIRAIGNKKGEMAFDVFDYDANIAYYDVAWNVYTKNELVSNLREQINLMFLRIKEIEDVRREELYDEMTILSKDLVKTTGFGQYNGAAYNGTVYNLYDRAQMQPSQSQNYFNKFGKFDSYEGDLEDFFSVDQIKLIAQTKDVVSAAQYLNSIGYDFIYNDVKNIVFDALQFEQMMTMYEEEKSNGLL